MVQDMAEHNCRVTYYNHVLLRCTPSYGIHSWGPPFFQRLDPYDQSNPLKLTIPWYKPKFDTHQTITYRWIEILKKMMPSKTIKLKGHGSSD